MTPSRDSATRRFMTRSNATGALVVHRRDVRRSLSPRHRTDRRPVSFQCPRLDRRLSESGLSRPVRPLRARLRHAIPVGAVLHPGERDVRLLALLGEVRVVERAGRGGLTGKARPYDFVLAYDNVFGSGLLAPRMIGRRSTTHALTERAGRAASVHSWDESRRSRYVVYRST